MHSVEMAQPLHVPNTSGRRPGKIQRQGSYYDYGQKKHYPMFVLSMMIACLLVMVLEIYKNDWKFEDTSINPLYGPSQDILIDLGAKRTDLILDGDWYRLVCPMFLHGGIIHFLFNMLGLYQVGVEMEKDFGWTCVAPIYLLSGLFGVVMSAIFVPDLVGVGASGAIFGVFGAAWADLLMNWGYYGKYACRQLMGLTFSTALNLGLGLFPMLDNFAHVGGFLTGVIVGLSLLIRKRTDAHRRLKSKKCTQIILQYLGLIIAPLMLFSGFVFLYTEQNADEWCGWCDYISCMPMPPTGSNKGGWWDCNECSMGGFGANYSGPAAPEIITNPDGTQYLEGTMIYECPSGYVYRPGVVSAVGYRQEDQDAGWTTIDICKEYCLRIGDDNEKGDEYLADLPRCENAEVGEDCRVRQSSACYNSDEDFCGPLFVVPTDDST